MCENHNLQISEKFNIVVDQTLLSLRVEKVSSDLTVHKSTPFLKTLEFDF
jgi:hypothetical protein